MGGYKGDIYGLCRGGCVASRVRGLGGSAWGVGNEAESVGFTLTQINTKPEMGLLWEEGILSFWLRRACVFKGHWV